MSHEPVRNLAEKVITLVAATDAVITVGVNKFTEILVCLYESISVNECILWVNVAKIL